MLITHRVRARASPLDSRQGFLFPPCDNRASVIQPGAGADRHGVQESIRDPRDRRPTSNNETVDWQAKTRDFVVAEQKHEFLLSLISLSGILHTHHFCSLEGYVMISLVLAVGALLGATGRSACADGRQQSGEFVGW